MSEFIGVGKDVKSSKSTVISDSKEENKTNIFIATPMYGGLCNGSYTVGLLTAVGVFSRYGIGMQYAHMMNESLITRARNGLAKDFLESDCSHLMFIDADIGFNPADIVPMIHADKDIICGIYPKKEINWNDVAKAVNNGVEPQELHRHTGVFVLNLIGDAESLEGDTYTPMQIANLLKAAGLAPSTSEANRNIEQNGVKIDGATIADKQLKVEAGTYVVQVGKRKFAKVILT